MYRQKTLLQIITIAALLALQAIPASAGVELSTNPLFLSVNVTPNVVMTIDDSGSMANAYTPEEAGPVAENSMDFNLKRYSSPWNAQYYNPTVTYTVPVRVDPLDVERIVYSTAFNTAYDNGFNINKGVTNLETEYKLPYQCYPDTGCVVMPCMDKTLNPKSLKLDGSTVACRADWTDFTKAQAAYYHLYYADLKNPLKPNDCTPDNRDNEACYVKIIVGSKEDIYPGKNSDKTASIDEKKMNFAIWYSFYRTRALMTVSAAMTSISSLGEDEIRLAWQVITQRLASGTTSSVNVGCVRLIPDPQKPGTKNAGTECRGDDEVLHENRMRTLDALKTGSRTVTHRRDFYDWLSHMQFGGATPLRSSMQRAGEYYQQSGLNSPYAKEPHTDASTEISCRRNFHLLFTDGRWNSDLGVDFGGNIDKTSVDKLPETYIDPSVAAEDIAKTYPYRAVTSYSPQPPYKDDNSNNLADLAFKFWITDLRPDNAIMKNDLIPQILEEDTTAKSESEKIVAQFWNPKNNPATWQHMVNFTVSLGIGRIMSSPHPVWDGNTYAGAFPDFKSGTTAWPSTNGIDVITGQEPAGHVYDLWHAAINSRGQFFSAERPQELQKAFNTIFKTIAGSTGASAAFAGNSATLSTNSLIFEASFDSKSWSGKVEAKALNSSTAETKDVPIWTASFPAPTSRKIFTANGTTGISIASCSDLTATQKTSLDTASNGTIDNLCTDRLSWLKGDTSKEVRFANGVFRSRPKSILGDIINSNPVYVYQDDYAYERYSYEEAEHYDEFVKTKASRLPMLYVGSNDGMLHAFRADANNPDSGKELFAFIPNAVFGKLSQLTAPDYTHQFYVDGSAVTADAYLSGRWKTVLVGGLNGGGKSIYALDISNPNEFNATNVLWEFSHADLGYTYSQPQIARLNNGEWAAVFGNGYSNSSENPNSQAYLYIVSLSDGREIKKIPAGNEKGNGLSNPVLYDTNSDGMIDLVYAGDILGNLWKFDLSSSSTLAWSLGNNSKPLFIAKNSDGQIQPITGRPAVTNHPSGGTIVNFGTGRLLAFNDKESKEVQSIYGIWDDQSGQTVNRNDLQKQEIIELRTEKIGPIRITSANGIDWGSKKGWYLDLTLPENGTPGVQKHGERVLTSSNYAFGRLFVKSYTPSINECAPDGFSSSYQFDPITGARPSEPVTDINEDGVIDSSDAIDGISVSGVDLAIDYSDNPYVLDNGNGTATQKHVGSGGSKDVLIKGLTGAVTRVFWQQLQ